MDGFYFEGTVFGIGNSAPALCAMLKEGTGTAFGMSAPDPIYLELVDFVASGSTPEAVANFHPSPEAQARVAELVQRERESQLTPEEASELAHFLELEHILRMAKARARLILAKTA